MLCAFFDVLAFRPPACARRRGPCRIRPSASPVPELPRGLSDVRAVTGNVKQPLFGGTMNHQIVYQLYYAFVHRNFSALRFNFRGVGRSQGNFDHGIGELSDAAAALDWAQSVNTEARSCWIAGFSFGAWIGMQLLMRRPEIEGFISVAPPANLYDFSFLAPCPSSGLIIHGDKDAVVPPRDVTNLVEKLKTQKGIVIEQKVVAGANHFFDGKVEPLMTAIGQYLDRRLGRTGRATTAA